MKVLYVFVYQCNLFDELYHSRIVNETNENKQIICRVRPTYSNTGVVLNGRNGVQ